MENLIDVSLENFKEKVLDASFQRLVLVDFWAPWCAPCRALGPILERLAQAYNGKILVAKLNTEDYPQIAEHFGIRGIPDVKFIQNAEIVSQFSGLKSEEDIRQMIDGLLGSKDKDTESEDDFLKVVRASDHPLELMKQHYDEKKSDPKFLLVYGETLFEHEHLDEAEKILNQIPPDVSEYQEGQNLIALHQLMKWADRKPRDKYDEYLIRAAQAYLVGDLPAAMEDVSQLLFRKKDYENGLARKILIALIDSSDDVEMKETFSRRLSMAIYS